MKAKNCRLLFYTAALLLAMQAVLAFWTLQNGFTGLLAAFPKSGGAPANIEELDTLCEEKLLLTYLIQKQATVSALHSNHSVLIRGTNYTYASIMGFPMQNGGFFTSTAQSAGERHAVLNETAAHHLFGSIAVTGSILTLDENPWLIVGVLADKDEENATIYVPACHVQGKEQAIMVRLSDETDLQEMLACNELKTIGVVDSVWYISNMGKISRIPMGQGQINMLFATCSAIVVVMAACIRHIVHLTRAVAKQLQCEYIWGLLKKKPLLPAAILWWLCLFCAGAMGLVLLKTHMLEIYLSWGDRIEVFQEIYSEVFSANISLLQRQLRYGSLLFPITGGAILLSALYKLFKRDSLEKEPENN